MAKRKKADPAPEKETTKLSWADIKGAFDYQDKAELIKMLGDLYRLSQANREFFRARYAVGGDRLKSYKQTIADSISPDVFSKKPIRVAEAKRAISAYKLAVGEIADETELIVYFVECGSNFTKEYGDIDGPFYDALLNMYERAIKNIKRLPAEDQDLFKERLRDIMTSCAGIGWGYGDGVCELFTKAFGVE